MMRRMMRRYLVASALVFAVLATACTSTSTSAPSGSSSKTATTTTSAALIPTGPGSAAAARAALCDVPNPTPPGGRRPEGTPQTIVAVEHEVEQVRGLRYTDPIPAEPLTSTQMANEIRTSFEATTPTDLLRRRSKAWATIGVIPVGTDIEQELEAFLTAGVGGFYVPETGRLVFIGQDRLSPLSHIVLAHELTHAIDDQHFDLDRLDALSTSCADEAQQAALGAVEGNAQYSSQLVAQRFLTSDQLLQAAQEAAAVATPDVPPFIEQTALWPYEAGLSFITALNASGGAGAVNAAIEHFPVSTEQIMHPEKYPGDPPVPVNVPDLGASLGSRWTDLDVSDVGEEFLNQMIALRLDQTRADEAAAGWGGWIYRAWTDGTNTAVVMQTVWDTPSDAQQFATTMSDWIDAGDQSAQVQPVEGRSVRVLFASDAATLGLLGSTG